MNKYYAKKTTVDGIEFDSKAESARYSELVMLQKAGVIRNLERQVRFELQPKFVTMEADTIKPIVYVADFVYEQQTNFSLIDKTSIDFWVKIIEDRKGFRTKEFLLKKKMLLYKIAKGEIVGKFIET